MTAGQSNQQCEACQNSRRVGSGPCFECSYVTTRSRLPSDPNWHEASVLTYREALGVVVLARGSGATVYGQLHNGEVEYIAKHPRELRWQFRVVTHEEGLRLKVEQEAALTKAQALRYAS